MSKYTSFAAALLCSVALASCGGGDSSTPTGGGPTPTPTPTPSPTPTPTPASYTEFAAITGSEDFDTACFTASPVEPDSMPDLFGPQGFGMGDALTYDGTALSVSISTQNGLSQSWTGSQRANATTGWGPDEDQYVWVKSRPSGGAEFLRMFVPAYSPTSPTNLNDYSRLIVADIVGVGTIPSLTYCVAGDPTEGSDLPTGPKSYPEVDVRWGQPWEFDGTKGIRGSFSNSGSTFEMDADFAAKTVSFNITLNSTAFALEKSYGPYTGTGTIGDNGEITADITTADGELQLRGSFFGPQAGEYALVYGLAEDTNNDGTNDLVFLGAVGARD